MLKKRIISFALAVSCACHAAYVISCKDSRIIPLPCKVTFTQTRDVFAMDTYMNLKAYGENTYQALADAERKFSALKISCPSPRTTAI